MKAPLFTSAAACVLSLGFSSMALAAPSPTPTASPTASPTADVTLYNGFLLGTKIAGSSIKNLQNQNIGTIKDLVVNPDTDRVRFAVLSVGGFLGLGDTEVVVPWGAIALEKNKPGDAPSYVIDATKDRLEKAPKFDSSKMNDLYAASRPIFDYYSVTFFEDVPVASPSPSPSPKK